jgi:hypothetical protein
MGKTRLRQEHAEVVLEPQRVAGGDDDARLLAACGEDTTRPAKDRSHRHCALVNACMGEVRHHGERESLSAWAGGTWHAAMI